MATTSTTEAPSVGADFTIETPVYLNNGRTVSHMKSTATALEVLNLPGFNLSYSYNGSVTSSDEPQGLLGKKYTVHPYVYTRDAAKTLIAAQEMAAMDVYFVCPYQLFAHLESQDDPTKGFSVSCSDTNPQTGEAAGYEVFVPGVYATSKETFTVSYKVFYRGAPLKSGSLRLRLFDEQRTQSQMENPNDVDPTGSWRLCDAGGLNFAFYTKRDSTSVQKSYLQGVKLTEPTYVPGYVGEVEIPVVDGYASYTIPALNVVACLNVVAEFIFPNDTTQSLVQSSPVYITNPFKLELMVPSIAQSGDDAAPNNIGAIVLYMGAPAPDDITVSFTSSAHARNLTAIGGIDADSTLAAALEQLAKLIPGTSAQNFVNSLITAASSWPPTPLNPAVSKTIDGTGIASGVFLGPHGLVINHYVVDPVTQLPEEMGDKETISATAFYKGFKSTMTAIVDWWGIHLMKPGQNFYYHIDLYKSDVKNKSDDGPSCELTMYADGLDQAVAVASLPASDALLAGMEDLIPYMFGQDANGNLVGRGRPSNVNFSGGGGSDHWRLVQPVDPDTGVTVGQTEGLFGGIEKGWAISKPIRFSRLIQAPTNTGFGVDESACKSPGCVKVGSSSFAWKSAKEIFYGDGCVGDLLDSGFCGSCLDFDNYDPLTGLLPPPREATINLLEPLAATFLVNGQSFSLNREGTPTPVTVDVTFSGLPIPFRARTFVDVLAGRGLAMPEVVFDIWRIVEEKDANGVVLSSKTIRDDTVSLTNSSDILALAMTDIQQGSTYSTPHYHECSVDNNTGVGATTFTSAGTPHTHTIGTTVAFQIDAAEDGHTHGLRSVARTTINPILNQTDQICFTAWVTYDASREAQSRTVNFKACSAVAPVPVPGHDVHVWAMELKGAETLAVQRYTSADYDGLTVSAEITHKILHPNNTVEYVPVEPGLRVNYVLEAYLVDAEPVNFFRLDGDTYQFRDYLILKVKASCLATNGQLLTAQKSILVNSNLTWVPETRALTTSPTKDPVYIDMALAELESGAFGSSALHDAVVLASSRLAEWQSEDYVRRQALKTMFLVTDGEENLSNSTIKQAIAAVNQISGTGNCPAVPVVLGSPSKIAKLILNKYASDTSGEAINLQGDIPTLITDLIRTRLASINHGQYVNSVDLGKAKYIKSLLLTLNTSLAGTSLSFRSRFSDDGYNYDAWTDEILISGVTTKTLDLVALGIAQIKRYMQYELSFSGNDVLQSPTFRSLEMTYVEPRTHVIFFQPIETDCETNEFVNELIVTHKTNVAPLSRIDYGVVQQDTLNEQDFYSPQQPLTQAGRRQIVLGRMNEIAYTTDFVTYYAVNGAWPSVALVEVRELIPADKESAAEHSGDLVDPASYSINPSQGSISFVSPQLPYKRFTISISMPSLLRIACLVVNYSDNEADVLKIDHVGLVYNITSRILENADGTTDYRPIGDIISSSSSGVPSSSSSSSGV